MSSDYGSGQSGALLVHQEGPAGPPQEAVDAATLVLKGKVPGVPPPCMDCAPNIVLKDYVCENCGEWEWGLLVAHDDTCPMNNGALTSAPRSE